MKIFLSSFFPSTITIALLSLSGCESPDQAFVKASKSYYEWTSEELKEYWDQDEELSDSARERRDLSLQAFEKAIEEAEAK